MRSVGENQILSSPATQDVDNSHEGLVDQKAKPNYNLRGKHVDAISEDDPSSSVADKQNGWPVSPETLALMCEEQDALFTPDASSDRILNHGCNTDVYAEQEMLVLVKFRDYLNKLIIRGSIRGKSLVPQSKHQVVF